MFNLGPMELLVIVVVALVVLGPQRLPGAMRQVGSALAEARRWSTSLTSTVQSALDDEARAPSPPAAVPAPADDGRPGADPGPTAVGARA